MQGQARLNAHEVAMTYSLLGFIAYTQEDLKLATTYYEKVLVKSKSIPKSLESPRYMDWPNCTFRSTLSKCHSINDALASNYRGAIGASQFDDRTKFLSTKTI